MGKDNVYFHTVYWPSVQLGDGRDWTKLHHLSTTGLRASILIKLPLMLKWLQSTSITKAENSPKAKIEVYLGLRPKKLAFPPQYGVIIYFLPARRRRMLCFHGRIV